MFRNSTFPPFLLIWITHGIGGFGTTFVLPTVIYELGISDTAISQLMTMHMPLFSSYSSRWGTSATRSGSARGWAGMGLEAGQIIFYILLITVDNATAKYIFVVVATAATQSFFPIIWPERIRATSGTTSAGLAIGLTNGATQPMGIAGPQVYQLKFGPSYKVSYSTSIGLLTVTMAMIGLTWFLVHRQDKRAEAAAIVGEGESAGVRHGEDKASSRVVDRRVFDPQCLFHDVFTERAVGLVRGDAMLIACLNCVLDCELFPETAAPTCRLR
ncbi:hypothetical protein diail_4805 [Diaporthe ilicicola]|nr:hypothetical protein diail_4805 [Diaporthe ilicicola]